MSLRGGTELRRRLKAIRTVFKPYGRAWAEDTVRLSSRRVRVRSGKTRSTIRVKNASTRCASVEVRGGGRFLEVGTKAHELKPRRMTTMKFNVRGQPMFTKRVKHPGMRAQPFLRNSASDVLEKHTMLQDVLKLWNDAA